ncbi:MAG: cyclic pyranopterin monophosphate synthase MoaC [Candidatus Lokiarchaeota archaeon]|nr:cyclic pyranopterin monophosphate synthase MoaC [Candidatus Lokiarchaeota archaeon]MBD3338887.1 cyclic pyranopterin monophosphate synthase MoaC [Candidatus Lokiarchaeota archaeon]
MIDITKKKEILRIASASGRITLKEATIKRIQNRDVKKGDVFTISKIAGINAVKKVPDLIPLCHPIPITKVDIQFEIETDTSIKVICIVKSFARTGVEMEALTGVSTALLNIWDIVKMYEKDDNGQYPDTIIEEIKVEEKIKEPNY